VFFWINDSRALDESPVRSRVASAAAATMITALMLVGVGFGFAAPATPQAVQVVAS